MTYPTQAQADFARYIQTISGLELISLYHYYVANFTTFDPIASDYREIVKAEIIYRMEGGSQRWN